MLEDHERQGQREGDPVLVEREERDDHEEGEMRLGLTSPRVDQYPGEGEQCERCPRGPQPATETRARGNRSKGSHGQGQGDGLHGSVAPARAEGHEARREQQREVHERPMASLPLLLGQEAPLGQRSPEAPHEVLRPPGGDCAVAHRTPVGFSRPVLKAS